jgi:peroxiredoxin (alkyl hydroperoxide reductase subunit C)
MIVALFKFDSNAQENRSNLLLIGDTVPSFTAATSQGIMKFPDDFFGKWKIIFSHPGDFTPVCTSEMLSFSLMYDDFKKLNCELIGLSVDGYASHLEWISSMENIEYKGQKGIQIKFPIISDVRMEVASLFRMVHPNAMSTHTIRAVFIINPDNVIGAILYYPANVGRSIEEIKRLLIALQTADRYDISTPAEWQPGDDIIVKSPQTKEEFDKKVKSIEKGELNCLDWYFCFKKI